MKAIEDGLYNPTMKKRMAALEREHDTISGCLDGDADADMIRLHPNLSALYADKASVVAAAGQRSAVRAQHRHLPRNGAGLMEPVRSDVRR